MTLYLVEKSANSRLKVYLKYHKYLRSHANKLASFLLAVSVSTKFYLLCQISIRATSDMFFMELLLRIVNTYVRMLENSTELIGGCCLFNDDNYYYDCQHSTTSVQFSTSKPIAGTSSVVTMDIQSFFISPGSAAAYMLGIAGAGNPQGLLLSQLQEVDQIEHRSFLAISIAWPGHIGQIVHRSLPASINAGPVNATEGACKPGLVHT